MPEITILSPIASSKIHKERVNSIKVPDDGNSDTFFSCSRDKKAYQWKLSPSESSIGRLIKVYDTHKHFVNSIVCANDVVITAGADKKVRIFGENELILKNHTDEVTCVSVNHDKNKIISGSIDNSLCLWNAEGKLSHVFKYNSWILCAEFVPLKSDIAVLGFKNGELKIVNVDTMESIYSITEDSEINSISITPDGSFCAYGTRTMVKIINLNKNFVEENQIEMESPVTGLAFSPKEFLIAISTKKNILLLNVVENKIVFTMNYEDKRHVTALAWSFSNLICGYNDGSMSVFECQKRGNND
ncbi:Guanine nucleotide-binding protein subunit beta-like protein [Dictyocoela muelleri]|nr:Guanine nucleotide-binding protein subunit beta-like protein [Dictyocoela muelleri]